MSGVCSDTDGTTGTADGDAVAVGADISEKGEEPSGYAHAFTLWCVLPQDQRAAAAEGGVGPSRMQLARLRVLQVSLFGCLINSFMGGVGMFDSTFLLGPLMDYIYQRPLV